jgi:hypothetical protein
MTRRSKTLSWKEIDMFRALPIVLFETVKPWGPPGSREPRTRARCDHATVIRQAREIARCPYPSNSPAHRPCGWSAWGVPCGSQKSTCGECSQRHRHLDRVDVLAGITAALSVSSTPARCGGVGSAKVRRAPQNGHWCRRRRRGRSGGGLAEHRCAGLPADERSLPSMDKYDIWLGRETHDTATHRHRAGRDRGDRAGLPHAARADDPRQVRRDCCHGRA